MTQPPSSEPSGTEPPEQPDSQGAPPPPPPPGAGEDTPPPPPPPGGFPPPPPAFPPGGPFAPGVGIKSHRANLLLFLGIFGLMCCSPLSFVAFFLGRRDLAEMDAGRMDPSGRSVTNFARILGVVGMVLFAVYVVYILLNWDQMETTT